MTCWCTRMYPVYMYIKCGCSKGGDHNYQKFDHGGGSAVLICRVASRVETNVKVPPRQITLCLEAFALPTLIFSCLELGVKITKFDNFPVCLGTHLTHREHPCTRILWHRAPVVGRLSFPNKNLSVCEQKWGGWRLNYRKQPHIADLVRQDRG